MTNNQEIYLPRKLTNQILHHAQLSPDLEICGLIGADQNGVPTSCYPIDNCAESPKNRFLLDSRQHISVIKQLREKNEILFAVYHSHPHASAFPSPTDIEQASYPNVLHLIISLNTKGLLELRAFSIRNQSVQEIPLVLIES